MYTFRHLQLVSIYMYFKVPCKTERTTHLNDSYDAPFCRCNYFF